ncbi:cholinesterase-like [Haemaphysalis longicornis]
MYQGDAADGVSEDCLHLNIWTPDATCNASRQPSCANRTVLFFLHGGFFQSGSNRDYPLDGSFLSALGDVVVVVPNYRLGPLGFLTTNLSTFPGNAGLYDQLLALEWTRAHIANFAGNGSDVVVMGHGAGADSIGLHLFSRGVAAQANQRSAAAAAAGMPRLTRAILMSGSPFVRTRDNTLESSYGDNVKWLAQRVSCVNGSVETVLKCLRDVDARALYRTELAEASLPRFFPTFRGDLLADSPFKLSRTVRVTGVKVLLGHLEDEAPYLVSSLKNEGLVDEQIMNSVADLLRDLGFSSESSIVVTRYYKNGSAGNSSHWAGDLLTDVLVVCPVRHFADYLDDAGNNSVHRYILLRNPSAEASTVYPGLTPRLYALRLVFGDPLRRKGDSQEQELSRRMIAIWTDFAKSGTVPAGLSESIFGYTIAISSGPDTGASPFHFRKSQCDFLKDHYL